MNSGVHPLAGVIAGAARLITGVNVRWLDSRPDSTQRIYFANHTSHLDFVVLWSALPKEVRALTRPVAAQDYWEKGMRHALAVNIFKAVLIPRRTGASYTAPGEAMAAARSLIDRLVEAMGEHYSLIIFPEGTRGSGEEVGAFKSGLFHLCQRKPGLQLVPAYLNNLNRILPKGEFLPVPFISQLTFGPPLALEPGEQKAAFLARAREAVCRLGQL
jgi:1-acyl-sn-glycerol-3-phosphate acyltransferase